MNGECPIPSAMLVLFGNRTPFHVARFVITVVLNAIQRQSFWGFANIVEKCLKGFQPARKNFYAPSAVLLVSLIFQVGASTDHVFPAFVSSSFAAVSFSARVPMPSDTVASAASAGCGVTTGELLVLSDYFFSALANTDAHPKRATVAPDEWFRIGDDFELSKLSSNDVDRVRHDNDSSLIVFVFSGGSQLQLTPAATSFSQNHFLRQRCALFGWLGWVDCRQAGGSPAGALLGGQC